MKAAIDIGTNSVLLLAGEPAPDGSVRPHADEARVTRLGRGLSSSGEISPEAAEGTLAALKEYMEICDSLRVDGIAAVGTAALRSASNASDFLLMVKRALGLSIEVISEEREAGLTYKASAHDFGDSIVVADVGGGSTELVTMHDSSLRIASLPVGCVNLTERYARSDPPDDREIDALRGAVRHELAAGADPHTFARPHEARLVATAGTATTLMSIHLSLERYSPPAVHGKVLRITDLRDIMDMLRGKSLSERRSIRGLNPERADVILAGSLVLHEAMSHLGYADVTVSDRGVKWGLFYEKFMS
ncbi:MAG: Ppx/GppA family phosphatase [Proteobacteria bacterium]|nr:Ppx/GppA family phosphatase [Pseudomonadota bacterium]